MNFVIIVAGGSGKRFSSEIKKQFFKIDHETIIEKTISVFNSISYINSIVVVLPKNNLNIAKKLKNKFNKIYKTVAGGKERKNSVFNGLCAIKNLIDSNSKILIHDAVRPFVTERLIINVLENLNNFEGVIPGISVEDTLKQVDEKNFILKTVNRECFLRIQTPQGFRSNILELYEKIINSNINFTDDAMVLEYFNKKVKVIDGEKSNIKITTIDDIKHLQNMHAVNKLNP